MDWSSFIEFVTFSLLLLLAAPVIGGILARCFDDDLKRTSRRFLFERLLVRAIGSAAKEPMDWKQYLLAILTFNGIGVIVLTLILMVQGNLPLNPQNFPSVPLWLALNTAISFVTNTNWQAYSGESTLSYFSQMVGLTTQNFVSAATGIAVLIALARGLRNSENSYLGNFWTDLVRGVLYGLLPLSLILALFLISQGVIQSMAAYIVAHPPSGADQILPMGPAASQIAIKQLGTNGGGFFGVNSAHPFENPTPLSNFVQCLSILLLPASLVFTFGRLVKQPKHGVALFLAMFTLFLAFVACGAVTEGMNHPFIKDLPLLEGKEQRFGIGSSVLWAMSTTLASNGSVNAMHSSLSPLSGGLAMLAMLFGEVVFGGVGSGLYGMVLFAILSVFIAGLMVGRTPEYLGKKIEALEIRAAAIGLILPSAIVLLFSATALSLPVGLASLSHHGPHGLSEVLYAFASAANNNGSAFAGLNANTVFYNVMTGFAMIIGRFGVILPVLYIAGTLGKKKSIPPSAGTFETEGGTFIALLCAVILIVGALTFFPALCLGPVIEHLMMLQGTGL